MELQITEIHNFGDIRSEYLELKVNAPVKLNNFILSNNCYTESSNTELKKNYWFPDFNISVDTIIKLHTRKGMNDYTDILNLYWNLDNSLWKKIML